MISDAHKSALRILATLLKGIDWRLVGSTNLALQGVAVQAKDIDIQIRKSDIDRTNVALHQYVKQPISYSETATFRSYFGRFEIAGIRVEVMAELQYMHDGNARNTLVFSKRPVDIQVANFRIPCTDLKTEYDSYIALERTEKASLIKATIEQSRTVE
jgi:hypothetical protein